MATRQHAMVTTVEFDLSEKPLRVDAEHSLTVALTEELRVTRDPHHVTRGPFDRVVGLVECRAHDVGSAVRAAS